jgi:hypothetical protein
LEDTALLTATGGLAIIRMWAGILLIGSSSSLVDRGSIRGESLGRLLVAPLKPELWRHSWPGRMGPPRRRVAGRRWPVVRGLRS